MQPGETAEVEVRVEGNRRVYPPRHNWSPLVWLRWNLKCRRGRDCAEIEIDPSTVPAGMTAYAEYTCAGCGTRYLFSSKHGRSRR